MAEHDADYGRDTKHMGGDENGPVAGDVAEELPDFYMRYYVGHTGRFGHEFLEFEILDGTVRYANHSKYRDKFGAPGFLIKKRVTISQPVIDEFMRIVRNCGVMDLPKSNTWPKADRSGRQELELVVDGKHVTYTTNSTCHQQDIAKLEDADGFRTFFYVVQDTKELVLALIQMHHRVKAV